ncbi:MAG: hypothetical protein Q7T66_01995 [Herminiimonas sp.]|uniref:hypothetical protein n=1 Tax=Herminiimonas sp. TaxID=1926289 RepID=UPI0027285918|nr:hypothetical protein [Herminiimonas sp.]MDO9419413.1 hypothetical protein [Herminiimonas sp.]
MKRCSRNDLFGLRAAALAVLLTLAGLLAAPAAAQTSDASASVRRFPQAALRGLLVMWTPPEISLNGKAERLSPGARIRNTNNNHVLPGALVGQELLVNYTRNSAGLVHEVWILSTEEAQEKRDGLPTRNFSFGFESTPAPQDDGKTPYHQLPSYKQ